MNRTHQNPGIVIMVLIIISIIAGVFGITSVKLEKGIAGIISKKMNNYPLFWTIV